jgi:hypothetical protein
MTFCFVCNASTLGLNNIHHIVPRADGGTDGPTVNLCASCHTLLHNCAKLQMRGKDYSHLTGHLNDGGKNRLLGLIQIILMSEMKGQENPHPLLAVILDSPQYLLALKLFQKDHGFTSQQKAVNAIFRIIALKYNLVANAEQSKVERRIKLSDAKSLFNSKTKGLSPVDNGK